MKRISIAAAIAALFLASAPQVFAQGTGSTPSTSATPTGRTAPAKAGDTKAAPAAKGGDTKTTSSQLDRGDRKFVEDAALDGMKEVEAGKVASGRASDPSVKAFADRMVKDHSDANKKLMDLAQSKGVTPPTELRKSDRRTIDSLARMNGDKLDQWYMREMMKDHKKDVRAFEKGAKDVKDPDVQRFAADTLPVLKEHLKMAVDTDSKVSNAKPPSAQKQ
jgi:putative membrane protein